MFAFLADSTIPGLGATDLHRGEAEALRDTTAAFADERFGDRRSRDVAHSLTGLDLRQLRDIGLERGAA